MGKTRVALLRCESYSREDVAKAIKAAVGLLGGVRAFVPEEGYILVKPNMLSSNAPDQAVTTHPEIVGAVVRLFKESGADIKVGDSPGRGDLPAVAERCGIASVCRELGVPLAPFIEGVPVKYPAGSICKEFILASPVMQAGVLINVAKMKTHGLMTYTGAVKNLFGCIPGLNKPKMHLRYHDPATFARMLLDLYNLIKPRLSIVDAVTAMDGDGPTHGRIRKVGAILASEDAVALDTVSLLLAGADPMRAPYLRLARELEIGSSRPEEIAIVGDSIDSFSITDYRLPPTTRATTGLFGMLGGMGGYLTARPKVDPAKCVGCRACAAACPPRAISISAAKKAGIDDKKCIRCYCCHEMCPEGAISLSRGLLARFVDRVLK